jgi:TetR/AcrR family transcriptional regulator, mexCD-oprJ operon repressor
MPLPERIPDLDARRGEHRHLLQERVTTAIVDAAAGLLAVRGASPSMADVAAAAGMARATVYRYFPTREALLERVGEVAISDAARRLREARLEDVPPEDALVRAIRALSDVGDHFIVLARERVHVEPASRRELLEDPLRRLFARGQRARVFRRDVQPEWLAAALLGFIEAVASASPVLGRDDTVERIASVFLCGIRRAGPSD